VTTKYTPRIKELDLQKLQAEIDREIDDFIRRHNKKKNDAADTEERPRVGVRTRR